MGTSARKGRRRPKNKHSQNVVGQFFEHLALSIIGGERSTHQEFGDIVNGNLALGIEVKAGDSNNGLALRLTQKEDYERVLMAGFPLDYFAYILFCYSNEGGRRVTGAAGGCRPLGRCPDVVGKYNFLAKDLREVYLLDLEVINALERKVGTVPCRHPDRGHELDIPLRKRDLKPFTNGSHTEYLKALELDPRQWVRGRYDLINEFVIEESGEQYTFHTTFPLITVLKKSFHKRFVKETDLDLPVPQAPSK